MGRCCVRACPHLKNRPEVNDKGIKCYTFPKDPEIRQKWIDWVNRANIIGPIKASKTTGVCSVHFTPDSLRPGSQKLRDDAIPSIAPEMTPQLAFKLGIARSAEDFIRSRQLAEGKLINEGLADNGDKQAECITHSDSLIEASDELDEATVDTSTSNAFEQAYSPYSELPSTVAGASSKTLVQRIYLVPIVKLKEETQIGDHDSSTDSCYSDPGESNNPKSTIAFCSNSSEVTSVPKIIGESSTGSTGISSVASKPSVMPAIPRINGAATFINVNNYVNASGSATSENILVTSDTTVKTRSNEDPATSTNTVKSSAASKNTRRVALRQQMDTRLQTRFKRKHYVRDLAPSDFNTPEKAKRCLAIVHMRVKRYQDRIKVMSQTLRRARKKIEDLESLLEDTKQKKRFLKKC